MIWTVRIGNTPIKRQLVVDVRGERIIAYQESHQFPAQKDIALSTTTNENPLFKYIISSILVIVIFWTFYRHISHGHADFKRAFWLGFLVSFGLIITKLSQKIKMYPC